VLTLVRQWESAPPPWLTLERLRNVVWQYLGVKESTMDKRRRKNTKAENLEAAREIMRVVGGRRG
jgi:hypothetical protein